MNIILVKAAEVFFRLLFATVSKDKRQEFLNEIEEKHGKSSYMWQEANFRFNKVGRSPIVNLLNNPKLLESTKE